MRPTLVLFLRKIALQNIKKNVDKAFSHRYLFYTNIFLSFTLSGAGDFIEQQYEIATGVENNKKYDLNRTRNMSLSGCSAGFLLHFWYTYLDRAIPGATIAIVAKKLILDQLVCSPLMIVNMFVVVGLLEKKANKEIVEEIQTKSLKLYIAEWVVWPPAQFINFYFVPGKFRILYDNIISFGYDIYYSGIKYR